MFDATPSFGGEQGIISFFSGSGITFQSHPIVTVTSPRVIIHTEASPVTVLAYPVACSAALAMRLGGGRLVSAGCGRPSPPGRCHAAFRPCKSKRSRSRCTIAHWLEHTGGVCTRITNYWLFHCTVPWPVWQQSIWALRCKGHSCPTTAKHSRGRERCKGLETPVPVRGTAKALRQDCAEAAYVKCSCGRLLGDVGTVPWYSARIKTSSFPNTVTVSSVFGGNDGEGGSFGWPGFAEVRPHPSFA